MSLFIIIYIYQMECSSDILQVAQGLFHQDSSGEYHIFYFADKVISVISMTMKFKI